jgi:hypothetical protein
MDRMTGLGPNQRDQRRTRPAVVIVLPIEGVAVVYLDAECEGDERRLRIGAARSARRVLAQAADQLEEAA